METLKKKKPKPPKPESRSWIMGPTRIIYCYASPKGDCHVTSLWEAEELTSFHDADLADATKKINNILRRLHENCKDPSKELSFIEVENGLFLVWTEHKSIGPHDVPDIIKKALRLNK